MNINYVKNIKTDNKSNSGLYENPLKKLSLGEISINNGWLRGQLELMCDGVTGRLPEINFSYISWAAYRTSSRGQGI